VGVIDPSRFNDPLALRIDWTPAKKGGTNIEIQRLEPNESGGMHFVAAPMTLVMGWMCLLLGVVTIAAMGPFSIEDGIPTLNLYKKPLIALCGGLAFIAIGKWTLHVANLRNEFNTISGHYIQGKQQPLRLSEIHALQLLGERVRGYEHWFNSYELNLVLRSGQRINVVDHGNLDRLYSDAKNLARLLDKPLWDVTAK